MEIIIIIIIIIIIMKIIVIIITMKINNNDHFNILEYNIPMGTFHFLFVCSVVN